MRLKRKGNLLLMADIMAPEIVVATLVDGMTKEAKDRFVRDHYRGLAMIAVYEQYKDNLNISNVASLLEGLEVAYQEEEQKQWLNAQ